jgi:hypothetical protein
MRRMASSLSKGHRMIGQQMAKIKVSRRMHQSPASTTPIGTETMIQTTRTIVRNPITNLPYSIVLIKALGDRVYG